MDDMLSLLPFRARVSLRDLCTWSCINKRLKVACYSPTLWRSVIIDGQEVRGNVYGWGLEMLSNRTSNMEQLILNDIKISDRPNPWMHFGFEKLIEASGKNLRILRMKFSCELPFTDLLLSIIAKHCPELEDVEISASNYFATDSGVTAFLRQCRKILHFRCFVYSPQPLHALGDNVLWQIGRRLPRLLKLEINANHVSENGILGIEPCTQLESLSLYGHSRGLFDRANHAKKQDGETLIFPSLKEIRFAFVLPSSGELRRLISMCPNLSLLELLPAENDERMIHHSSVLETVANAFSPELAVCVKMISSCSILLLPPPKKGSNAGFADSEKEEFQFQVPSS